MISGLSKQEPAEMSGLRGVDIDSAGNIVVTGNTDGVMGGQ